MTIRELREIAGVIADDKTIRVLWECFQGEACTNTERPGVHSEWEDAGVCCGALTEKPKVRPFKEWVRR